MLELVAHGGLKLLFSERPVLLTPLAVPVESVEFRLGEVYRRLQVLQENTYQLPYNHKW